MGRSKAGAQPKRRNHAEPVGIEGANAPTQHESGRTQQAARETSEEPSSAEVAAAVYAAEMEAQADRAGVGRSVRARHLLITIGQFVVHVVALSVALSVAGFACIMFPPLELQSGPTDPAPLSELPPLPVMQDIPSLASFLASSFDDATEDLVKVMCLYATYSSGQLLATWVQFGVLPTAYHRERADQLWCATAGSMTAALMYPRCNGIGDRVGDYVQMFQNRIREEMFGMPPKPADRSRPIKSVRIIGLSLLHVEAWSFVPGSILTLSAHLLAGSGIATCTSIILADSGTLLQRW